MDIHAQIEPIQQWTRDTVHIILFTVWCPLTGLRCIRQVPAFAGIGGSDQYELAGVFYVGIGVCDHHLACFNRLP